MMSRILIGPEEWQQVLAYLPGVFAPHAGFERVMRQPLRQDVRCELLFAPAGITPSACPDSCLGVLPGVLGVLLAAEGARRSFPVPAVEVVGRVARLAVAVGPPAGESHDHHLDPLTVI
jgi:hypothetical protein